MRIRSFDLICGNSTTGKSKLNTWTAKQLSTCTFPRSDSEESCEPPRLLLIDPHTALLAELVTMIDPSA